MKKAKLMLLLAATIFQLSLLAQAPQKFSYQAVVKNASNNLVTNHAVGLKLSILNASSTVVYCETQSPVTNANGLISVEVGAGTVISGTMAGIAWSSSTYSLKSEIDPAGGTSYSITGTSSLLSVPYALHAKTVDGLTTALDLKVDKVLGKGLSTNDYTTAEQTKLSGIATGAQVNVKPDWNAASGSASEILNKPSLGGTSNYIQLKMSAPQGSLVNGTIVAFNTTFKSNGLTSTSNGINLKAGVTYRVEAGLDIYAATDLGYLGYTIVNTAGVSLGSTAYAINPLSGIYDAMRNNIVVIYTPATDETIYVKITDQRIGTGTISDRFNPYFIATEMTSSIAGSGGGTVTSVTGTSPISVATGTSTPVISLGIVPVANGGTGTATGSITGTTALTFAAGGTNQNVNITPSGTGYTLLNGNVGIGTTTPLSPLDVRGLASASGLALNMNFDGSTWRQATTGYGAYLQVDNATGNFYFWNTPSSVAAGGATTTPNQRLTITSSGNVGIGTTTPSAKLSVLSTTEWGGMTVKGGTTADGSTIGLSNSNGLGNYSLGVYGSANTGSIANNFYVYDNVASAVRMTVASTTGNLGIGTTTPAAKLHIAGADMNNALLFENTSANPGRNYILFKTQGTEQGYIGLGGSTTNHMSLAAYGASNNIYFDTNSLTRMTILPSGNVGIGTTTPAYKLHVSGGTIRSELGSTGVSAAFLGGGSNLQIYHNSGSSVYFWNTAGGVYEFYNGAGSTSTGTLIAGAFNTGSDRRLKNNIVNTHFGINDLMKIQVRDYEYKADASKTLVTGFIAQELYDIFPNAVTKPAKAEDMWSVDYGKVTPLLVKAVQDQQKTIETLKTTVQSQQAQIDELKSLLKQVLKK